MQTKMKYCAIVVKNTMFYVSNQMDECKNKPTHPPVSSGMSTFRSLPLVLQEGVESLK